jgi:hypothetical protein
MSTGQVYILGDRNSPTVELYSPSTGGQLQSVGLYGGYNYDMGAVAIGTFTLAFNEKLSK